VRSVLSLVYDDSAAAAYNLAGFAVAHKVDAAALWTLLLLSQRLNPH
jgi:hypothetical protein